MIKQQQHQQPASSVGPQAAAVAAAAAGGCEGRSFANGGVGTEWNSAVLVLLFGPCFIELSRDGIGKCLLFSSWTFGRRCCCSRGAIFQCILNVWVFVISG